MNFIFYLPLGDDAFEQETVVDGREQFVVWVHDD